MSQHLVCWDMLLQNIDYLMEREREVLLRTRTRYIDLPVSGRKRIEAYDLVWTWYDRLVAYPYGNDQPRLHHFWERCINEECLSPSDALVRLVFEIIEGYDERDIDVVDDTLTLDIARERMANWRERKQAG